jgi:hypothetical protein
MQNRENNNIFTRYIIKIILAAIISVGIQLFMDIDPISIDGLIFFGFVLGILALFWDLIFSRKNEHHEDHEHHLQELLNKHPHKSKADHIEDNKKKRKKKIIILIVLIASVIGFIIFNMFLDDTSSAKENTNKSTTKSSVQKEVQEGGNAREVEQFDEDVDTKMNSSSSENFKQSKQTDIGDIEEFNKEEQNNDTNDIKKLNERDLAKKIEQTYKQNGFTKDIVKTIELFEEYNSRDISKRNKIDNIDVHKYQSKLISFFKLNNDKEQVNQVLKKHDYMLVYSLLNNEPSQVSLGHKDKNNKVQIWNLNKKTVALKRKINKKGEIVHDLDIETKGNSIVINLSDKKPIILSNIDKKDINKVKDNIKNMINRVDKIEKDFNSENNNSNYNYTKSDILEIYNNDKCKLIYQHNSKKWTIKEKKLAKECGKYEDIDSYLKSDGININNDLTSKKPEKHLFFNNKTNKVYESKLLDNFDEKKDLVRLSKDKDIVFSYKLKSKKEYEKYSVMPRYTNIKIDSKSMSLIRTAKKDGNYYVYLTKKDTSAKDMSTQLSHMKDKLK